MSRSVLLTVVLCAAALAPVRAQTPQNVFVVIMDGLRDDEGFGAGATNMPHIWNDLRPLGTQETRFWDRGWTATTGGHTTIWSGVRQVFRNNGSNEQDIRSFDPLASEYFRKCFGAPESSVGVVFGKWGNMAAITDFGLEPSFGAAFRGFRKGDSTNTADSLCSRWVHRVMDSLHPRLLFINLADIDHYGHTDTFSKYVNAIHVADSIVYEFYKHIQAIPPYTDTFYRNRTVLFITSDHGRNDDAHGSFNGHGEWDHGSRQIGFLALGPGIAQNRSVTSVARDQIDIVPTIGAILGFPVPFAEGDVMTELFTGGVPQPARGPQSPPDLLALNLSNNTGFSRDPDITRDRSGNLFCVWTDKTAGYWQVLLRKSTDAGLSWGAAQTLFNFPAGDSQMWYARVAADDSLMVSGMGYGKHLNPIDSLGPSRMDTTFIWYPWLAASGDGGASWRYTSLLDSNMGSYYAPVTVKNGRFGVAWWSVGRFSWQVPANGMHFNNRGPAAAWRSTQVRPAGQQALHLAMADDGTNYHLTASAWRGSDFDIGYYRSTDGGTTWATTWIAQDGTGSPNYDYDPELVVDDSGMVHVFWARKQNTGGVWRVMYARRNQLTGVFDTTRLATGLTDAWQPHAARRGDTLMVVYIDYATGSGDVYATYSTNRGTSWSTPERITWTDSYTQHPRVTATGPGFYCVWQDYATGNWEVYGRELDLGQGRDVGTVRIDAPLGTLDSLAAVRPRATFQNYGPMTATFKARFKISDLSGAQRYLDSIVVLDLGAGAQVTQAFGEWAMPHPVGTYVVRCSTAFAGDYNTENNLATGTFTVVSPVRGWVEKAQMPSAPSGRAAKDGAWLAYSAGRGLVYAAKGYKTRDFFSYSPAGDSWTALAEWPDGAEARQPQKGSVGTTDAGRYVYATKGNNTIGFWRYDATTNSWLELADVPLGVSGKKVRGGTDLAHVPGAWSSYVYLLKGYKNEFYKYDPATNAWATLPDAPVGANLKWDKGSWLAFDGGHTIYAHKAKYHEFYSFNTQKDSWSPAPLHAMPFLSSRGSSKKAKDGSSGAWWSGSVFALKGGNTQEFWKYVAGRDSWAELETMPALGSSGRKKKVKAGGDIVNSSPGVFFALKGNGVNELWRYFAPVALERGREDVSGQMAGPGAPRAGLSAYPNPPGRGVVRLDVPGWSGEAEVRLYDALGRCVGAWQTTFCGGSAELRLQGLGSGAYLVRVSRAGLSATRKLIVE